MAKQPWYDRPIDALYGMSAKDTAVATGLVVGVPAAAGYAHGRIAKAMSAPAAKRPRQVAPRYLDGGRLKHDWNTDPAKSFDFKDGWKSLSPRTRSRMVAKSLRTGHVNDFAPPDRAKAAAILRDELKRTKAAAKGTATKVANGTIQPFKATRVGGRFATNGQKIAATAGKALGTAGRVLGVVGAATTVGAIGLVGYNLITGKHASDRDEAMKRENDPGRIATSGVIGTATTAVANRAMTGVVVQTAGGMIARAAGPVGLGVLAGYGAYKGYAEEGPKGAVRGAIKGIDPTALFMSRPLSERLTDKVLGPKQVDRIGPLLKAPFKLGSASPTQSGDTYQRTYTRGPKAGTTETVRKT